MTTSNAEPGELSAAQRAAIAKCDQAVEDYRTKHISKASAVRLLTTTISTTETGLDDAAADSTLDSYLEQLGDTDRIRREAGEDLQRRFRGESDGDENHCGGSNPERQVQARSQSTLRSRASTEEPGNTSLVRRKQKSRSSSYESSSDEHNHKRQRPNPAKFPWTVPEAEADKLLRPELRETLRRLKEYAKDVKFCKANLVNSAGAPEFPDSEWTNLLNGHPVDLDRVLSNLYTLSSDDKHIEQLGDVELRYRTVAPVKTVQSAGDWVIAWQRTVLATVYAFPHRRPELDAYHAHIFGLFSAVDKSLHHRVIHYDKAVRKYVNSVRNVLLSDTEQFNNLRTLWIDSCGANVLSPIDSTPSRPSTRSRRDREACIRWNKGMCTMHPSDCRYRHVCSTCGGGHARRNCKHDQQ